MNISWSANQYTARQGYSQMCLLVTVLAFRYLESSRGDRPKKINQSKAVPTGRDVMKPNTHAIGMKREFFTSKHSQDKITREGNKT